jgi:hypothetical protein
MYQWIQKDVNQQYMKLKIQDEKEQFNKGIEILKKEQTEILEMKN